MKQISATVRRTYINFAVVVLFALAFDPLAAHAAGSGGLPPIIAARVEAIKNDCTSHDGRVGKGFLKRKDVNGDGIEDFILDFSYVECGGIKDSCGTGGCSMQVWASNNGTYVRAFNDTVRGVSFVTIRGRPAMRLEEHGVACGRPGSESCFETLLWTGDRFSRRH